jgi:hypothetical protein
MTFTELHQLPTTELARLLRTLPSFDARLLGGSTYRGISVGLPALVERLLWRKFAKHFDQAGAGFNVRIIQNDLTQPWLPQRKRNGDVRSFGPFRITTHGSRVELDYSIANPLMQQLRDPLVAIDARADLLVGCSQLAVGQRRLATPSYFVLQRDSALTKLQMGD